MNRNFIGVTAFAILLSALNASAWDDDDTDYGYKNPYQSKIQNQESLTPNSPLSVLCGLGVRNLYPGLLTALAGRAGFQLKGLAQLGGNLSVPRLQGDQIQLVQFAPFFGK